VRVLKQTVLDPYLKTFSWQDGHQSAIEVHFTKVSWPHRCKSNISAPFKKPCMETKSLWCVRVSTHKVTGYVCFAVQMFPVFFYSCVSFVKPAFEGNILEHQFL